MANPISGSMILIDDIYSLIDTYAAKKYRNKPNGSFRRQQMFHKILKVLQSDSEDSSEVETDKSPSRNMILDSSYDYEPKIGFVLKDFSINSIIEEFGLDQDEKIVKEKKKQKQGTMAMKKQEVQINVKEESVEKLILANPNKQSEKKCALIEESENKIAGSNSGQVDSKIVPGNRLLLIINEEESVAKPLTWQLIQRSTPTKYFHYPSQIKEAASQLIHKDIIGIKETAQLLKTSQKNVRRWVKCRSIGKSGRKAMNPQLQAVLTSWILKTARHDQLSHLRIRQQAKKIACKEGNTTFQASKGWLQKYLRRNPEVKILLKKRDNKQTIR